MARPRRIDLEKTAVFAAVANALQIVFAAAVAALSLSGRSLTDNAERALLIVMALVVIWGAVLDIREAFSARHVGAESEMLEDAYDRMTGLNATLRKQRHDFMNHLQVVYSLLELDSQKEALEYIEQVYGDIQKVGRTLKTAIPAVNALLAAKLAVCEEKGIVLRLDIRSAWDGLPMTDWEMCRVLGNLIDNAIEALEGAKNPSITILTFETMHEYGFRVCNNGPAIDEAQQKAIFREGFTTKLRGSGMGLAIVREILSSHGGGIYVISGEEETCFIGSVRKKMR
ncbi:MAG: sensor histidine kinase [Christensenellales bacterium]|jgi:two-component system sensor histidine kinase AgrC